jgi:ring-1,2-phenylacetyl-CoA epoxidase subunit PaaC
MMQSPVYFSFLLRVADTNLILSQRLSEWTGHGPFLEEDLALTNIALDMLGTARSIYEYAAKVEGKGRSDDDLAFLRNERQFLNPLICELPKGDYAFTIARLCIVNAFQFHFYQALSKSSDEIMSGIAAKAIKETTYHLRHTSAWMERFGCGTEESHSRLQNALNEIWRFTDDIFDMPDTYAELVNTGLAPEMEPVKEKVKKELQTIMERSELQLPESTFMQKGSIKGIHSEHLGYLLAEMQYMQRMYPGTRW